jgi:hypothetical protein
MSLKQKTLVLLAGLSLTGVVLPQKKDAPAPAPPASPPSASEPARQAAPTHVSLAELMGADVVLEASAADKSGAGKGAAAETPKGKVAELVVSTRDGEIACAALSVGKIIGQTERIVLVPMTAIQSTMIEKRPAYLLRMTKSEIEALPPFEIRKSETEGLDRAVEQARGLSGAAKKGKESGDEGGEKAASKAAAPEYVLSGVLKGCAVDASDKAFGKVQDAAVDVGAHTIGYLVVARGESAVGSLTVVPFRACQWTHAESKDALKLGKSLDQLKAAPEYKKPEKGLLTADQMRNADGFFGGGKAGAPNPQ